AFVAGQCESQRVSQRGRAKRLDSQCERDSGTVRAERTSPAESLANGVADRAARGAIFLSSRTFGEGRSAEAPKERSEGVSPFLPGTPGVSRAARAKTVLSRVLAESAERAQ